MIAVDTNVVVRLLTKDDAAQFQKSYQLFDNNDVFITDSVILETEWVLRFAYGFDGKQISTAFNQLLGLPNVNVTQPALLAQAIAWHEEGLDFADAFHLAYNQYCKIFYTFDQKMSKVASKIGSCKVNVPT
ncbi:MAG: type II toxin-antitoxin system VapC family toxin [Gammaproteobacteria bacterium]|nr:type II toxin-antitoxin system VapC family toxin [Gammaproteobacteria bacterium]